MATAKKATKSKFIAEDISGFLNEGPCQKESPKGKKSLKRQTREDGDFSQLISQYVNSKKKKIELDNGNSKLYAQKVLNIINQQLEARKQGDKKILRSLTELLTQHETDYNAIKDNEQKLEHLTNAVMKCMQQMSAAQKQKIKALKEIQMGFKQEVEGLLSRGGMKLDDRPLWFDVYKAFPPIVEPKFARAQPEIKPIRQILYQEDVTRAKFHSKGRGLEVVNMLNPNSETQTKRLLEQYEKLKSEEIPEDVLIEKCVAAVEAEKQMEAPKTPKTTIASNPESVTAQVLAEADIKNIFKE